MAFTSRKRVYANAFRNNGSRMQKRPRFTRKRRFTRTKRTTDYTSLATRGTSIGFRGRKTTRRAYKRHIWNSTVFKNHWRSIRTLASGFTTPATETTSFVQVFNMYRFDANPFFVSAGGAQEIDAGVGVPGFEDVILRGGKFELTVANQSANDIKVKIYRMTTGNAPDFGTANEWPGPLLEVDQAWDPSVVPDVYTTVGKPFLAKEVTLEGGNSYTFVTRFKSQKIDVNAYLADSRAPYIIVHYSNVGNVTANALSIKRAYNLSFAGDAVAIA